MTGASSTCGVLKSVSLWLKWSMPWWCVRKRNIRVFPYCPHNHWFAKRRIQLIHICYESPLFVFSSRPHTHRTSGKIGNFPLTWIKRYFIRAILAFYISSNYALRSPSRRNHSGGGSAILYAMGRLDESSPEGKIRLCCPVSRQGAGYSWGI